MGKFAFALTIVVAIIPGVGHAQVTLDMTQVTCASYLAMSPDQGRVFSAWMSGWYNQKLGRTTVSVDNFARYVSIVHGWCTGSPSTTVMTILNNSDPLPGPPPGLKVDMSQITCKQYLSSDADRQDMIAYWLSGYFRASRNQPTFDFQRFADNKSAVGKYCKKRGKKGTVITAIQNSAR
jgi:HdeA/HdeB family